MESHSYVLFSCVASFSQHNIKLGASELETVHAGRVPVGQLSLLENQILCPVHLVHPHILIEMLYSHVLSLYSTNFPQNAKSIF